MGQNIKKYLGVTVVSGMVTTLKLQRIGDVDAGCIGVVLQCHLKPGEKIGEATSHRNRLANHFDAEGKPNIE